MSELFCKRFSEWVEREIGMELNVDFLNAIIDRDIELVYIMKRDPEWLANQFSILCQNDDQDYERSVKNMFSRFKVYEKIKKNRKDNVPE